MQVTPQYQAVPQQSIIVMPPLVTQQIQIDLTQASIANINIPDQVNFEHIFEKRMPSCFSCNSILSEISIFNIPGLGTLKFGYMIEIKCGCPKLCCTCLCDCAVKCIKCDQHFFPVPSYQISNELIRIEYWNNGVGNVYVGGLPVLKFIGAIPNICDTVYGHCRSGFPKVQFTCPLSPQRPGFMLRPDPSPCPETCASLCGVCCGVCGTNKSQRNFHAEGLTQGTCTVVNTRTCSEACAKVCMCQGKWCYPQVDYPRFQVQFQNVQQIDKLAILVGLIHHSIFKKWYYVGSSSQSLTAVA